MKTTITYEAFLARLDMDRLRRLWKSLQPIGRLQEHRWRDACCREFPDLDIDVLIKRSPAERWKFYYSIKVAPDGKLGERLLSKLQRGGWVDPYDLNSSSPEKHIAAKLWVSQQPGVELETCTAHVHFAFWIAMWLMQGRDPLAESGGGHHEELRLSRKARQLTLFEAA